MEKERPAVLWVALATMVIIILLNSVALVKNPTSVILATVLANVALVIGLFLGHKWAYVVCMLFSLLGVIYGFKVGPSQGMTILFGNALVVVPVLIATRFYFPRRTEA